MSKKILLTGGNGFIGKNIQESFLAEKYDILAPRRFELDLTDAKAVDDYFSDKEFDVVLHCGAKAGHRNARDLTNLCIQNVSMFENLAKHNDKFRKFINFGSGAIYDLSDDIMEAKEESIFEKIGKDEHSYCKYLVYKQIVKLENFVDLNIFGVFGKYEDWQIRFISNAICKTLFDLPITLRQNRRFSYLYIDDLMPILEFFIENNVKYKSYNVVPDEKTTLLEVAKLVQKISAKEIEIQVAKKGFGLDYTGDNSRLKNEFCNIKFTKLEESVSALYNYYKVNLGFIDKELLLIDK